MDLLRRAEPIPSLSCYRIHYTSSSLVLPRCCPVPARTFCLMPLGKTSNGTHGNAMPSFFSESSQCPNEVMKKTGQDIWR